MKILIIGSLGFIGSHCSVYFKQNHDVWGCDIYPQSSDNKYHVVETNNPDYKHIFQSQQFDLCINCAGSADVSSSFISPISDFKINTVNVINILEAIRNNNPTCKFLTISSAAIYGNPPILPISTQYIPDPISPYGFHKSLAEVICKEYNKLWGMQTCCIRVFSAYGPGLKKQLFWDLYNKFETQKIVELWGTGEESRDFIYISDLMRAMDITIQNSHFQAEIINVANGVQTTISTVAKTFAKEIESDEKTVLFSSKKRTGDPINWEADITELRRWGYHPLVSLEEGIRNYIQWARKEKQ